MLEPRLPVTFRFEGLQEVFVFQTQTQASGRLARLRCARRHNLEILDEFGYDHVISPGPMNFAGALLLRSWEAREIVLDEGRYRGKRSATYHKCEVLLCISCEEFKVVEGQREAWAGLFGSDSVWILDRFNEVRRDKPFYGLNEIEAFLREIGAS